MKRPRKRTLLVLGLFIGGVGGAIINVAVAWGCVIWTKRALFGTEQQVSLSWPAPSNDDLPAIRSIVSNATKSLTETYADSVVVGDPTVDRDAYYVQQWEFRAGIPMRTLGYVRELRLPVLAHVSRLLWPAAANWCDGIQIPNWIPNRATFAMDLPVRPLWPGFAINTIFYAAILWLLLAFPFKLRRWRRLKRGLCPACAYPVGASPVCTECGKRVLDRHLRTDSQPPI